MSLSFGRRIVSRSSNTNVIDRILSRLHRNEMIVIRSLYLTRIIKRRHDERDYLYVINIMIGDGSGGRSIIYSTCCGCKKIVKEMVFDLLEYYRSSKFLF